MVFRSHLDRCSRSLLAGWAWDSAETEPVSLIISVNGTIFARCLANRLRGDLVKAGIGSGRHAFDVQLSPPLSIKERHVISIRREDDGQHIAKSPFTIEPSDAFDDEAKGFLERLVSTTETDADFEQGLAFLNGQIQVLRQRYSERRSGITERQIRHRLGCQEPDGLARVSGDVLRPAALVIDDCMPDVSRDAGSNAIFSHMCSLRRLGFDVFFAPLGLRGDPAELAAEEITCCLKPWYDTIESVLESQRGAFDLVYLHRVSCAERYAALVRHHQPRARLIFSVADLGSLRAFRQAEVEGRPELEALSRRLRTAELGAVWHADAVITHSSAEAEILKRDVPQIKVHVVPWSVPIRPTVVPFAERHGIAFIGGYGHQPNVDAARWLVEAVMPRVAALDPTITCYLVGSDMPDSVRRLVRDNVVPIGHVADLSEIFAKVRLTVAPLAYGAGVKGKVLVSLAAGVPCACTPVAAEGIALPPPQNYQVAADPAVLAMIIHRLHADASLNKRCAEAGLAYVAAELSDAAIDSRMSLAAGL